ncbi:putative protein kinase RLK-Pelle-WAK family [Helianthus annuus]|nr:putative protein kinase RLK-Pelle-WAK family [Helianthus annuus]
MVGYRIMKRRKKDKLKKGFFRRNGGLLLQQQMSAGDDGNVEKTKLFTSKELEKATDHFNENRILGQGGQGTVYKGMLTDGNIVAFTEKSDVYSFGVVLVELLTGEKPIASFKVGETRSLATYFLLAMEENRLSEIVDPRLKIDGEDVQVRRFADLAKRCLNLDGRKRPRMKQVSIELELIRTSNEPHASQEVEYDNSIEEARVWDAISTGIESGPISIASSSDSRPLLL